MKRILMFFMLVGMGLLATRSGGESQDELKRMIVQVPPREIGKRAKDGAPAEYHLAARDLPAN